MDALQPQSVQAPRSHDAVIVGAGFGGLYMLHRLRGLGLSARVYEQGSGVGGTWYWNRYPGARCDVESMQYSYGFSEELQQEWQWSERYAPQPEILRYANHVADRFDLRRDIQFDTRVTAARFDDSGGRWSVTLSDGVTVSARYLILATGCLSNARTPDFPGLDSFKGKTYHTGHWPHQEVDFTGLRVGMIGTGSSAIQSIPIIAEQAAQLVVFQRTANFSVPAHNAAISQDYAASWKTDYAARRRRAREEARNGILTVIPDKGAMEDTADSRRTAYEAGWARGGISFMASYNDLLLNQEANDTACDFVRDKIAEIVRDPAVARLLQPNDHPIGSKRICVDTDYYATFNRPNVSLVNVRAEPIERILPDGLRAGGKDYPLDAIVFATGFDAMTGSVAKIDIHGRDGRTLNQKWAEGPRCHLGLMSAGFPNLFIITGPGSPSVLSNMIVSIEQHVDWITGCIAHLRARGFDRIEPTVEAEDNWVAHVNEVAHRTLYPQANSWYMGANIPGKPRIFMPYIGGVPVYRQICDQIAARDYEGFVLTGRRQAALA
ncbi:flavin-containing monooxygenase [Bradyrhizobium sp. 2TAF24]|uniref:flavin-containing monooxygenase n=1 Tax=Bradyrhizobium sp. 2TAF24 TaxID=3233011 RepID=UPI003F8F4517